MPRPSSSSPPIRHTADPGQTRADLAEVRAELLERYDAELPGARASVMGRLLGALDREPLPGLISRRDGEVSFPGVTVRYPREAAAAFAVAHAGLIVRVRAGNRPADQAGSNQVGSDRDGSDRDGEPGAVLSDPATLVRVLWPGSDLAAEIDNSVANMALARAARTVRQLPRAGDPDGLARAEQSIVDGHPLHPCARTRGGMSVADVLAYAPEHSPVFRLRRLRVPADRWYGGAEPILLAHPWQADHLRDRYPWLGDDGETSPVRPLMSLRTVVPVGGGPHLKTAVDVQMTSAVRTVSPAAVHNGPVLSRLLRRVLADLPIDVLAETGAGAVLVDGQPQRHLAYLTREAPRFAHGETVVPLALYGASELLLSTVPDPYDFMGRLASLLFAPLVSVLDRGIALEAHGQNTLVVLRDHRPTRILYRDLGGVRVSGRRLGAAGIEVPRLIGDLPTDDPQVLRTKLSAAAFGTVAAELVAALTRHHGADPQRLWAIVAAAVRDTGTSDAEHLLRDPLPVKATTAMRLAADQLDDIWAYLDNPMAEHA
ncbi:IucA/IucC family protein [Paractinoplanes ferrugineus]|uniref:IucA/IucC family protein n=1 Tax=Paractinoplanes ferrugineus TaxID=113564 RepID=UPI0031D76CFF